MTIYTLLTDLAFASLLILVGQLLRAKIKFIQSSFMPASLLAGFMGLALGAEFLIGCLSLKEFLLMRE